MQQYPPQQPSANYPPSEMYVQEQPPTFASQHQPPEPFRESAEIAIGYNRRYAIIQMVICIVALIVLIALLPILLISGFSSGPFEPGDVLPLIFTLVILFAGIAFVGWTIKSLVSQRRSHKAILLINREGITIQRVYLMRGRFVPWAEIGTIYPRNIGYKYLCIKKKNITFGSIIMVPQMYLEKPVEEILQALYHTYSSELNHYRIQLRS